MTNVEKYTISTIVGFGYKVKYLHIDDVKYIFDILTLKQERGHDFKFNNHNYEMIFSSFQRLKNRYSPIIEEKLKLLEQEGKVEKDPDWIFGKDKEYKFAAILTHDIDHIVEHSVLERIRLNWYSKGAPIRTRIIYLLSLLKNLIKKITKPEQWVTLEEWVGLEEDFNFKSTMFFLGQPLPKPHYEDTYYLYCDKHNGKSIKKLIQAIEKKGWDVGLHGSVNSHNDSQVLSKELKNLNKILINEVISTRQHHLCYDSNITGMIQDKNKLLVDSTIGSNIDTDYRVGTSLPYFKYDVTDNKQLNIVSIPLIIQDVALFNQQKLPYQVAKQRCEDLIDVTLENNSIITILWHNSFCENSNEVKLYKHLLKYIKQKNGCGYSLRDFLDMWKRYHTQKIHALNLDEIEIKYGS